MDEDGENQVRGALLKGLVALVGIAVAIALGTLLMVRALDLDEGTATGPLGAEGDDPDPLPSTALPVPGQQESERPSPSPSASESTRRPGRLQLQASPTQVGVSERINLTGRYRNADSATLQVQRFEGGSWVDFPVDATVSGGSFQTWILTSRTGEQRLRMLDTATDLASNEVTVTVG